MTTDKIKSVKQHLFHQFIPFFFYFYRKKQIIGELKKIYIIFAAHFLYFL